MHHHKRVSSYITYFVKEKYDELKKSIRNVRLQSEINPAIVRHDAEAVFRLFRNPDPYHTGLGIRTKELPAVHPRSDGVPAEARRLSESKRKQGHLMPLFFSLFRFYRIRPRATAYLLRAFLSIRQTDDSDHPLSYAYRLTRSAMILPLILSKTPLI